MTAPVDPDQPSPDAAVVERVISALQRSDEEYGTARNGYYWPDMARAVIKAHLTALQEAGFVVVPREPTEAMVAAAEATGDHWYFDESWAAMIAASEPSHPKDSP